MKEYIEGILHQDIQLIPYENKKILPLVLKGSFELFYMTIGGVTCLLAKPGNRQNLATLRKQLSQVEAYTEMRCVLFLEEMTYYARDTMIREGIPFVWSNHQIYLPFLGLALDEGRRTSIATRNKMAFLTQKLLLIAIYYKWQEMTVTKTAKELSITKTSASRCFDELEAFSIPGLKIKNRSRFFSVPDNRREFWEKIQSILRSPVITSYQLKEPVGSIFPLAGYSALAYYTMLNDSKPLTIAVPKKDISSLNITNMKLTPSGESPECVVQEVGYQIIQGDGIAMDPLSLVLSLSPLDKEDPRISKAVDEMLEEYVW